MSPSRYARELDLSELNAHTMGIKLTPPGSRVLDVGSADGSVAGGLQARGCRVTGIEIDEEFAAGANDVVDRMIVGDVERLDLADVFGGERFDVVLCLDVLEHLVEPVGTLRRLAGLLEPGGSLVASIPNVTHAAVRLQLISGRFTYTDTGLLDRTHLHFFDRDTAEALFADAELTVIERLAVYREVHETEIQIEPETVSAEVLAAATADPDARVFQWVLVAKPKVESAEAPLTGLVTDLMRRNQELDLAGRQAAEHIAWLEGHLSQKSRREQELELQGSLLAERVAGLETLHAERAAELVERHEQLQAVRADLQVKDDYVAVLVRDLEFALSARQPSTRANSTRTKKVARRAVTRAAAAAQRHPRTRRVARRAVRLLPQTLADRIRRAAS